MNKYTIITLIAITVITSACNKQQQHYEMSCEPIVIPTYGYGSSLTYKMKPTDSRTKLMTFHNDHNYPVKFSITFGDIPEGINASIKENEFSLTATKEYKNYMTLTTTNAEPGVYEVPVTVSTDKDGEMGTTLLQITISDNKSDIDDAVSALSYVNW